MKFLLIFHKSIIM